MVLEGPPQLEESMPFPETSARDRASVSVVVSTILKESWLTYQSNQVFRISLSVEESRCVRRRCQPKKDVRLDLRLEFKSMWVAARQGMVVPGKGVILLMQIHQPGFITFQGATMSTYYQ